MHNGIRKKLPKNPPTGSRQKSNWFQSIVVQFQLIFFIKSLAIYTDWAVIKTLFVGDGDFA